MLPLQDMHWLNSYLVSGLWIPRHPGLTVCEKVTVAVCYDYSHTCTNMFTLFVQVSRPAFCPPLGDSSLHLWTLLSLTSSCLIIFSGLTSWTTDNSLVFVVKKRCMIEMMPCWIYWHQKTSAGGSCTPYKELINSMLLTLSLTTEVRDNNHFITVICRM